MKKFLLALLSISLFFSVQAQIPKGRIIVDSINGLSLKNSGGENPTRRITVYLPPNYDSTNTNYPVIYYLHGFAWSDSALIASDHFDRIFDKAIATGQIRPVIVVMPNEYTLYKGSFYTNSSLTGNWSDFTAKDLVQYIDQHYRTIPTKESRGIAGHSMGGHGAIKIAMLFPDVFSSVYAMSPAALYFPKNLGQFAPVFKRVQQIKTRNELVAGWNEVQSNIIVAMGRAFSPNPDNPPFYTNLPYTYQSDSLIENTAVLDLWNKNAPFYMIDSYIKNIKKLKAIKLDWGRNDEFTDIPVTCKLFSKQLEKFKIKHYAEEYIGTHGSEICTDDGRMLNELLPFFNRYLQFK